MASDLGITAYAHNVHSVLQAGDGNCFVSLHCTTLLPMTDRCTWYTTGFRTFGQLFDGN
jgi:hypothetical protein